MIKCNTLRYNCGDNAENCFNRKKRLKFHVLEKAMPRRIGFSDIDGFSEINGYCCFIEWKEPGAPLEWAQETAFKRLSALSDKIVVFVVAGDAEHMTVSSWRIIYGGQFLEGDIVGTIDDFVSELETWGRAADMRWVDRMRVAEKDALKLQQK